ncbi:MAG: OsmC family protein [Krumholzibacteria bacterium]|nr:OsmC family protein [Candidatus Krumholzibacteria bacterium]
MQNTMTATWAGGMRFVHRSASGHAVVTDTPADQGGLGSAASPMELVILGLIGCTGVDVASILHKMKQSFESLEVAATYERAADHPRVYTRIHVTYTLRGDLDLKKVRRAVELSEKTYCSVTAMLRGTAEITSEVRINP